MHEKREMQYVRRCTMYAQRKQTIDRKALLFNSLLTFHN